MLGEINVFSFNIGSMNLLWTTLSTVLFTTVYTWKQANQIRRNHGNNEQYYRGKYELNILKCSKHITLVQRMFLEASFGKEKKELELLISAVQGQAALHQYN